MKRKRTVLAAVLMLAALAAIVWLYVCRNQKSSDNLPSLANLVQMEEGAIDETVCGYRRAQLCSVWGEPEESGAKQDVWTVGELTLTVRYQDGGEKAVSCGLSARVFLQQTDVVQVTHFLHTDITERSLSERRSRRCGIGWKAYSSSARALLKVSRPASSMKEAQAGILRSMEGSRHFLIRLLTTLTSCLMGSGIWC